MNSLECWSCRSNRGEERISPGPPIHVGEFWQVEHAYPTRLPGWLVIVLRRHAEALHELRTEEFGELAHVLERTVRVLHQALACEKEYVACYAEIDHFRHVHFHVVPRAADLPADLLGTNSFALLKVTEAEAVSREEIRALCETLRRLFEGRDSSNQWLP
ncbi:MAG TPA: HIT domain-containing protein [Longimicrobium sp.]|nr:HIT domain-containing protein [Longimicrobium sp.]